KQRCDAVLASHLLLCINSMKPGVALKKEVNVERSRVWDSTSGNGTNIWGKAKRLIVGKALRNEQAAHERLTKKVALAVFSSDALSSTAYATEEILLFLATAAAFGQGNAFSFVIPVSIAIAVLLAIVTISYRQTIHAYPTGGGAYIVAKEN